VLNAFLSIQSKNFGVSSEYVKGKNKAKAIKNEYDLLIKRLMH
jgi:hypothetical protein